MLEEHSICKLFRTTKYYFYFNLLQLVLSLVLLITLLLSDGISVAPIQISIGVLLAADIIIRFFSDSQFIHKIYNKIDLILLVLVVAMVTMELFGGAAYEPLEQLGNLALAIRFGLQLFRVMSLIKQYKQLRMMHKMGDITLPATDMVEQIENYQLHINKRPSNE